MKLKELRKQQNLTQVQVSQYLNTTHQTYNNYENGKYEPSIDMLIKLADLYNTSIDFIVGRNRVNDVGYLNSTQIECVNMIKQLNETNLIKLMGYLSAMISMQ